MMRKQYEIPTVEVVDMLIEAGFALSGEDGANEGFDNDKYEW